MTDSLSPDVTFVIAAFNAGETLGRAIDSALAQQGVSVEVIVVDDCSADDTRQIVESHADERVRLIALERNRGPGGARNAGLAAAQGTWIAILDSDDTVHPDRLVKMIKGAGKTGAQIVVDNIEVVSMDGLSRETMFSEARLKGTAEIDLAAFIGSNIVFKSVYNFGYMKPVFQRQFLIAKELRFDESLKIGEDYILLASALAKGGRCVIEPSAGYVYHVREGSISRVLEIRHVDAMIEADERFVRGHTLNEAAKAAQKRRNRSLAEARSFLTIVQHIKDRSAGGLIRASLRDPRSLRHLSMPIAARLRRLLSPAPCAHAGAAGVSNPGRGPQSSKG